jgi:hypothetical protein
VDCRRATYASDTQGEESNGDLLALAQDPLTPPSLFLVEPQAAPALLKRCPQAFDPAGLVIRRHEAVSSDGMRIPFVQVGPPGETGDAPVHMYGLWRLWNLDVGLLQFCRWQCGFSTAKRRAPRESKQIDGGSGRTEKRRFARLLRFCSA